MNQEQARDLADLLIAARQRLGLSVREVGRRSGVQDTTVMRLEHAVKLNPRPDTLRAIAESLKLDLADVYATSGYVQPQGLPSFRPYLRTKYGEMPEAAVADLEAYFAKLTEQHGVNPNHAPGPAPGEDET